MKRLLLSLSILFVLVCGNPSAMDNGPAPNSALPPDMAFLPDLATVPDLATGPTLTGIAPASGPIAGGTDVTISGTNFDPDPLSIAVRFGGNLATVKSASPTQVVATTPAGPPGSAAVVVTNGSDGLSVTWGGGFYYWSSGLTLIAGGLGAPGSIDGTGLAARFVYPAAVALDDSGNMYVADSGNHTIRKVVLSTGEVTTLAGAAGVFGRADGRGAAARFYQPRGVAVDSTGNLYVADFANSTIRKVVVATGEVTTLAGSAGLSGPTDGIGTAARFLGPTGLALDDAGTLYVADWGNHTIRKVVVATGVVTTLAGTAQVPGIADGTGTAAGFTRPEGVALDGAGNLYVADYGNDTIRTVVLATGAVTTLAGTARFPGSADGTGPSARFRGPQGVAVDGSGKLYVAENINATLRTIVIATGAVTTLAGSALREGNSDGTGTAARFSQLSRMASDRAGHLYVADLGNHTLRKVDVATAAVTTFAGSALKIGSSDGTGTAARFYQPSRVASDGSGNLYIADSGNTIVRQVEVATGAVTTLAGTAGGYGYADGTGAAARFNNTAGVALDGAGNLYVADSGNHAIRKVVVATGAVTTLVGAAFNPGSADGTGPAARFRSPMGLTWDGAGALYVADTGNHTLRKVSIATGEVTTLAGVAPIEGNADGVGRSALFRSPSGVVADGAGNLYVADTGNHAIRRVVIATGQVTTLAGLLLNAGSADGTKAAARFNSPTDVGVDGAGNVYVADTGNNAIRKVSAATGSVQTLLGVPGQRGAQPGPLPARLNQPQGLAVLPSGAFFLVDSYENAVLAVR